MTKVLIEVSARHIHLSKGDAEVLFGKGHEFTVRRHLKSDEVYVTEDSVELHYDGSVMKNVRIIMPFREKTGVELSATDVFKLTRKYIFKESVPQLFDIAVVGPKGRIYVRQIPLIQLRHLHASPADAEELGLDNGDMVSIKTFGPRSIILNNVKVRIHESFHLCCHLDIDEGHAAGISLEGEGLLLDGSKGD